MNSSDSDLEELVDEYRKVLVSAPSAQTLVTSVALLEKVLGGSIRTPVDTVLDEIAEEDRRETIFQQRLSDHLAAFIDDDVEQRRIARRRKENLVKLQQLSFRSAFAVLVPEFLATEHVAPPHSSRHYSLAIDIALVIFHQSYFYLLEELKENRLLQEANMLLHSFSHLGSALVDSTDKHAVLALLAEATGDVLTAERHRLEALATTDAGEHQFMTVLQQAWGFYAERRRFTQAALLLIRNAAKVSPADIAEYNDLLIETASLARQAE